MVIKYNKSKNLNHSITSITYKRTPKRKSTSSKSKVKRLSAKNRNFLRSLGFKILL